jgi:hypothetical protein
VEAYGQFPGSGPITETLPTQPPVPAPPNRFDRR